MHVRTAERDDLPAIVEIQNQAIAASATAHLEPLTVTGREQWFASHGSETRPILVAELSGGVIGWVSLSDYRPGRGATRHCSEISYFVHTEHRRQGVASTLVKEAISRCDSLGITTLLAILLADNAQSVQLLRRFGFQQWACLPGVANVQSREVDHLYYGLRVSDATVNANP